MADNNCALEIHSIIRRDFKCVESSADCNNLIRIVGLERVKAPILWNYVT